MFAMGLVPEIQLMYVCVYVILFLKT